MQDLEEYIRINRPGSDKLEYDRMVRLLLNWIDNRKIREPRVFLEQEGKEYQAMIDWMETTMGREIKIDSGLFRLAWASRLPA